MLISFLFKLIPLYYHTPSRPRKLGEGIAPASQSSHVAPENPKSIASCPGQHAVALPPQGKLVLQDGSEGHAEGAVVRVAADTETVGVEQASTQTTVIDVAPVEPRARRPYETHVITIPLE